MLPEVIIGILKLHSQEQVDFFVIVCNIHVFFSSIRHPYAEIAWRRSARIVLTTACSYCMLNLLRNGYENLLSGYAASHQLIFYHNKHKTEEQIKC